MAERIYIIIFIVRTRYLWCTMCASFVLSQWLRGKYETDIKYDKIILGVPHASPFLDFFSEQYTETHLFKDIHSFQSLNVCRYLLQDIPIYK